MLLQSCLRHHGQYEYWFQARPRMRGTPAAAFAAATTIEKDFPLVCISVRNYGCCFVCECGVPRRINHELR